MLACGCDRLTHELFIIQITHPLLVLLRRRGISGLVLELIPLYGWFIEIGNQHG